MKLEAQREHLLKPLQQVIGVVERRQTLPILANVLLVADGQRLTLTATDLEVELAAQVDWPCDQPGEITVPGRKVFDILRALPDGAGISLEAGDGKLVLRSGRSRFTLATLPAADFPAQEAVDGLSSLTLARADLARLIGRTQFAMAQQDVRYYLNGLLLDVAPDAVRAVATDGHRLAYAHVALEEGAALQESAQVIVPRKGIQELARLLGEGDGPVTLHFAANHIRVDMGDIRFTSKLIDGKFPDYKRVIPRNQERALVADRPVLRAALSRVAILSTDKFRGGRLTLSDWLLKIQANNPEQEEAEEELEVNYSGGDLEIGFNVGYLLDALGALDGDLVKISLSDSQSSCLIQEPEKDDALYVVMPMRL